MKNKELIEKLKEFDEDLEVVYTDIEYGFTDIKTIKESTKIVHKDSPIPGDRIIVLTDWT